MRDRGERRGATTMVVVAAGLLSAIALLAAAHAEESTAEESPKTAPPKIHADSSALEEALIEANRAALRDDPEKVMQALNRVRTLLPPVTPEARASLGDDVYAAHRAFQSTLQRAREFTAQGDLDETFNEMVWVQRACRFCHGIARTEGILPEGPLRGR